MLSACRNEQHVARVKRVFFLAILKNTVTADDDINLILRVRLL